MSEVNVRFFHHRDTENTEKTFNQLALEKIESVRLEVGGLRQKMSLTELTELTEVIISPAGAGVKR
jgi:hypothetical protein